MSLNDYSRSLGNHGDFLQEGINFLLSQILIQSLNSFSSRSILSKIYRRGVQVYLCHLHLFVQNSSMNTLFCHCSFWILTQSLLKAKEGHSGLFLLLNKSRIRISTWLEAPHVTAVLCAHCFRFVLIT